jgi:ERO1-like protein alpha
VQGEHAHRIWDSIYSQNCFKNIHPDKCDEESLVFYRIISGVHASISMHIAREYLLDPETDTWGTNMDIFRDRMADPAKCDHVRNLYFAYLFVSRAVARAAPAFKKVHFHTGMPEGDLQTKVRILFPAHVAHVAHG